MADPLSTFTGLSSGMDWRSLVDQMMQLERRPADRLQDKITANTKRKDALGQFQTLVQAMKDAAARLSSTPTSTSGSSPFESFVVSTSGQAANGRNVLVGTAGAGASSGAYAVKVTALAAAQKWTGAANVPAAQTLPAGATLTLTKTDASASSFGPITVGADWTLARLRDEINAKNAGSPASGVAASIVNVSATEQRLVLTSTVPGAANGFTLADDGTSGLLATLGLDAAARAANPTLTQGASDAAFSIDGVAMTRTTNTVSDALTGVTLTLAAVGDGTVSVDRQAGAATDALKGFVDAYNKVQAYVQTQGRDPKAALYNDPLLRTVRSSLGRMVVTSATPASQPGGAAGVADDLTALSSLGVSLQKDGTLSFDASKFTAASSRLADVRALLTARMDELSTYADALAKPLTGQIDQREVGIELQNARMTARIDVIDARLEKRRASLVAQYAKFEASLGSLKALGEQMSAQFSGLNKSSDKN
jgi:flagellar hook-associated protein 2